MGAGLGIGEDAASSSVDRLSFFEGVYVVEAHDQETVFDDSDLRHVRLVANLPSGTASMIAEAPTSPEGFARAEGMESAVSAVRNLADQAFGVGGSTFDLQIAQDNDAPNAYLRLKILVSGYSREDFRAKRLQFDARRATLPEAAQSERLIVVLSRGE